MRQESLLRSGQKSVSMSFQHEITENDNRNDSVSNDKYLEMIRELANDRIIVRLCD